MLRVANLLESLKVLCCDLPLFKHIVIFRQTVGGIYSSHMIMLAPLPISCNVGVASGFRFFVELSGWPPTLQSMGEGAHNHEGRISSAYRLEVCCFSLP